MAGIDGLSSLEKSDAEQPGHVHQYATCKNSLFDIPHRKFRSSALADFFVRVAVVQLALVGHVAQAVHVRL